MKRRNFDRQGTWSLFFIHIEIIKGVDTKARPLVFNIDLYKEHLPKLTNRLFRLAVCHCS